MGGWERREFDLGDRLLWWEIGEKEKVWREWKKRKKLNWILAMSSISAKERAKRRRPKGSCYWKAVEKGRTNQERSDWESLVYAWNPEDRQIAVCANHCLLSPQVKHNQFPLFLFMIITNMCGVLNSPQSTFTTLILFGSCPLHHSLSYVLFHSAHQGNEVDRSRGFLCVTQLINGGTRARLLLWLKILTSLGLILCRSPS